MPEPRRYKHPSPEASFKRAMKAAGVPETICGKPEHRCEGTDWKHPGGSKVVCGICHPSPYEPAWSEWVARQGKVVTGGG